MYEVRIILLVTIWLVTLIKLVSYLQVNSKLSRKCVFLTSRNTIIKNILFINITTKLIIIIILRLLIIIYNNIIIKIGVVRTIFIKSYRYFLWPNLVVQNTAKPIDRLINVYLRGHIFPLIFFRLLHDLSILTKPTSRLRQNIFHLSVNVRNPVSSSLLFYHIIVFVIFWIILSVKIGN